jgi:hypothetical protein
VTVLGLTDWGVVVTATVRSPQGFIVGCIRNPQSGGLNRASVPRP